jgi:hypothetical protein
VCALYSRVHIENSGKPNEAHPGTRSYEQEVSTLGQVGTKLTRQPIIVAPLPVSPTVASPIIVQAQPLQQFQPHSRYVIQPQIPEIPPPQFEIRRKPAEIEIRPRQPAVEIRPQPQVDIRPRPTPQTIYFSPSTNTHHYLQYEHQYFHAK